MAQTDVGIPEELLPLLKRSRLGELALEDQVRTALAIQLFQEGVISLGRTAEIAHRSYRDMETLLIEIGIPPVRWDMADYERELAAAEELNNSRE